MKATVMPLSWRPNAVNGIMGTYMRVPPRRVNGRGRVQPVEEVAVSTIPRPWHPRVVDLTGIRFGTWTAVERVGAKWLVRCDCGREKFSTNGNLRSGHGLTCPECNPKQQYNRLADGEASLNALYNNYQQKARKRRLVFSLTRDEFRALTEQPCAYCGQAPAQKYKTTTGTPYAFSGVDRVDPTQGYRADNCRPCCKYCNFAKNDMTLDEWLAHVERIYKHMKGAK